MSEHCPPILPMSAPSTEETKRDQKPELEIELPKFINAHPVDVVNRCATKIDAVNVLLSEYLEQPERETLYVGREVADGLYWMLLEVSEELKYSVNRMSKTN